MHTRTLLAVASSLLLTAGPFAQDAERRALVEATFDPNGAYDDGASYKDPFAPYEDPLAEAWLDYGDPYDEITAAPINDHCSAATIIPGSAITYTPPVYSTTTATTEGCEAKESCGGIGTSHTVWYSYTPTLDGVMRVSTTGSSYDTVLSVFSGCGFQSGIFCISPTEYACNNDYTIGTSSQVTMEVFAGQSYKIKIGAAFGSNGGNLDFSFAFLPPNDDCSSAIEAFGAAFDPPLLSTHNAQSDLCETNESCELNGVGVSNSVWYRYVAPCDGMLSLNTNGSDYDTVLSVWDGCAVFNSGVSCTFPSELACDDDSGTGTSSQIVGLPVMGGETYLIKVADYNTTQGGGFLDFNLLFDGASQPTADLTSPSDFGLVCSTVAIQGTADTGGSYTEWDLDYRPSGSPSWSPLASGTTSVVAGTLATWNTSALTPGYYLLRLTVANACGLTETDTSVVWVDDAFSSLELRLPSPGAVLGRRVTIDGTAWDPYFSHYVLEYRPTSGSTYSLIDPGSPTFPTAVVNDPFVSGGWDTIGNGIPDGGYVVRVRGVDQCGHTDVRSSTITVDNTLPVALIANPTPRSRLRGTVAVRGTASDAHLASWALQVTGGTSSTWTTIAQGTSSVTDALLASWDTDGLAPGPYTLRLSVADSSIIANGQTNRAEYLVSVFVGKASPVVVE